MIEKILLAFRNETESRLSKIYAVVPGKYGFVIP